MADAIPVVPAPADEVQVAPVAPKGKGKAAPVEAPQEDGKRLETHDAVRVDH